MISGVKKSQYALGCKYGFMCFDMAHLQYWVDEMMFMANGLTDVNADRIHIWLVMLEMNELESRFTTVRNTGKTYQATDPS